jgi:hypothetical protein
MFESGRGALRMTRVLSAERSSVQACLVVAASAVFCLWGAAVTAQKSTEMFIPIGQSPGLAGKTSIGTIESVNVEAQELVVVEGSVRRTIRCDEHTPVWIDRSAEKQPNQTGSLESCRAGQRIEVKFVDDARDGGFAEWIKIAEP